MFSPLCGTASLSRCYMIINFLLTLHNNSDDMKRILTAAGRIFVAAVVLTAFAQCGSQTEKAEQDEAADVAAQMEGPLPDPATEARAQARKFAQRQWPDSLRLHEALLEVKAAEGRYILADDKEGAALFDSVFISDLRTVNPALAAEIEPAMK